MEEKKMLESILEITKQTQQGLLELKDDMRVVKEDVSALKEDVAVLKTDVAELKVRMTSVEERVTNIEDNMIRKNDLKYFEFKIAEHDKEIFQLKNN